MNTNLIDFLKEHPETDFTVKSLAKQFDVSETDIRTVIIPEYLQNWKEGDPFIATTVRGVCATHNQEKIWESRHWKTVRFSALKERCELEKNIEKRMFPEENLFSFESVKKFAGYY